MEVTGRGEARHGKMGVQDVSLELLKRFRFIPAEDDQSAIFGETLRAPTFDLVVGWSS
jgi:hypothetical protein